jgi:hypothetical protein
VSDCSGAANGQTRVGGQTLGSVVEHARWLGSVEKSDLYWGDRVLVATKNSLYSIVVLGENRYLVSGGWFDRRHLSPATVTINGCTWGGSVIKHDIVAAPGLFLEFGNKVMTTRIKRVRVIRSQEQLSYN